MINHEVIAEFSEMTARERQFVLECIEDKKPKKILEIGVAAGANSTLILDFLEKHNSLNSTAFYAIDYNKTYYRDLEWGGGVTTKNPRESGFLVDLLVPHLKDYYRVYKGGYCANYLENVGDSIDLCIIDTVHAQPGEGLDFLMVLPYLSENATIILHDIAYHTMDFDSRHHNICALLFLSLFGKKTIPRPYDNYGIAFQNIGACVLDSDQSRFHEYYFRILHFPWVYMPSKEDMSVFKKHIAKHYSQEFIEAFSSIEALQSQWFNLENIARMSKWKKFRRKVKSYFIKAR